LTPCFAEPPKTVSPIGAGIAAALQAGALTADAVALEARKAPEAHGPADTNAPKPAAPAPAGTVTSLTERRLAQLPPDRRPSPSVAQYDQLLPDAAAHRPLQVEADDVRARL
jgi:hypothetical protein